jgi:hypothetical protein
MTALAVVLAVLAILVLILAIVALTRPEVAPPSPIEDIAMPYREGLHAAVQMQRVAQDLEQQIYAAAARHLDDEPASPVPSRKQP